MSTYIRVTPDRVRTDPRVDGLSVTDTEWELSVGAYREFLVETTGVSPEKGLSASDCYLVGNRLEAYVEERKRRGEWDESLLEEYPDVESLDAIVWIARVFRACHDCHVRGETCYSRDGENSSDAPSV